MNPRPVAVDEQLPEPIYACKLLCRSCRTGLLYQRQDRPKYPRHFDWCPRCGARYACRWDNERWTPPGMGVTVRAAEPGEQAEETVSRAAKAKDKWERDCARSCRYTR